jgi:threonine aldolase
VLDPVDVKAAIVAPGQSALAPTKLICLENTHNASGGTVLPLDYMAAIHGVAKQAGLPMHVDGARLFNAATHLGAPVIELCRHTDSVWFALCKGLGAPVGAILAGNEDFMTRARQAAKMLGGAMRQAGLIAAPAIVALKDPYGVHRRDHELAQRLARGLAAIDPSLVQVERVHTNIVNCFVDRFADDAAIINRSLKERGVLANHKRTKIRFVTHYHIDEAAVDAAIERFAEVIEPLRKAA